MTFLLGAIVPSMAAVLAGAGTVSRSADGNWFEVCTSSGIMRVALPDEIQTGGQQELDRSHGACLWCLLHSDALALPPGIFPMLAVPRLIEDRPAVIHDVPRPQCVWHAVQPRGPPLVSLFP